VDDVERIELIEVFAVEPRAFEVEEAETGEARKGEGVDRELLEVASLFWTGNRAGISG
jgi:hypothetical protein